MQNSLMSSYFLLLLLRSQWNWKHVFSAVNMVVVVVSDGECVTVTYLKTNLIHMLGNCL